MSEAAAKTRRQRKVADLLRTGEVSSQEDLVDRLASEGLSVTQATVSRDLAELGAVRVRRDGRPGYALPEDVEPTQIGEARLTRLLREWLVSAEAAGGMVVLRTPPGSAHVLGSALDHAGWAEIAGTIAGDDTLLLVVRDGFAAGELADKLSNAASI